MTPEHNLWDNVLIQAGLDVLGLRPGGCPPGERKVLAWNARAWFRSTDTDIGSFLWVAANLNFDPDRLRCRLFAADSAAVRREMRDTRIPRGRRVMGDRPSLLASW